MKNEMIQIQCVQYLYSVRLKKKITEFFFLNPKYKKRLQRPSFSFLYQDLHGYYQLLQALESRHVSDL